MKWIKKHWWKAAIVPVLVLLLLYIARWYTNAKIEGARRQFRKDMYKIKDDSISERLMIAQANNKELEALREKHAKMADAPEKYAKYMNELWGYKDE